MGLKLGVGKHYVNGFGKRVGPMVTTDDRSSYEWYSPGWESYTKEGLYWADQTSKHGLVSEWVEPKVEPELTPFGELTPAEQGALLLAFHNRETIQRYNLELLRWIWSGIPEWSKECCYRIKPKPKMQAEYWVMFSDNGNPLFVATNSNYQPDKGYYKVHHPAVEIKD